MSGDEARNRPAWLGRRARRLGGQSARVLARAMDPYLSSTIRDSMHAGFEELREQASTPPPASRPPYPHRDFPELTARHVEGARLFARREDLVADLEHLHGGVIAEVGVAMGDFSQTILEALRPSRFVALDIFTMHHESEIWGKPVEECFHGLTHKEFYTRRFAGSGVPVEVVEGLSSETLDSFPDHTFDMIYIDAGHDYDSVASDACIAKAKIKEDGVLVFNDYTMYDHLTSDPYGIVPAVNELVVTEDWRVLGFALQHQMFCDIAIQRRSSAGSASHV